MTLVFFILIVLACFLLAVVVLVQNPKGGGLSGTFGGFSNQLMGVKQTTDVLEKGTWLFSAILGLLCLISTVFLKGGTADNGVDKSVVPTNLRAPAPQQTPNQNTVPLQGKPTK